MNLACFFEVLAQNLEAISEELELDLTTIREIEFAPSVDGRDWWVSIDTHIYAQLWLYQGKPTIAVSGHFDDTWYHLNPFPNPNVA